MTQDEAKAILEALGSAATVPGAERPLLLVTYRERLQNPGTGEFVTIDGAFTGILSLVEAEQHFVSIRTPEDGERVWLETAKVTNIALAPGDQGLRDCNTK